MVMLSVMNIAAQQSTEKVVNEFSTLKTFDLIEVNLIPSSENKVVITGTNPEDVSIVQTGKTLKIRMTLKNYLKVPILKSTCIIPILK